MQPIWKDYKLTAAGDAVDYVVYLDGAAVYHGRAYRRPGAALVEWSINDIAADYLANEFPTIPASGTTMQACKAWREFTVEAGGASTAMQYINDWSYKAVADNQWRQLLQIFDTVDARLPLVYTANNPTPANVIHIADGEGNVTTGPLRWRVGAATCWRWALYFLNAFGGWSFIYLEAVKPVQDYARKTAKRVYSSDDLTARGAVQYLNQITQRWTAKTPYLTDAQAAQMWHVLGTTAAVLFDMATGEQFPVNVTDGGAEQQTYRNQGAKRPRYDINLTLAQDRLRR